jgi:hypothetical protein
VILVARINSHVSPRMQARQSSRAKTRAIRGEMAHDDDSWPGAPRLGRSLGATPSTVPWAGTSRRVIATTVHMIVQAVAEGHS